MTGVALDSIQQFLWLPKDTQRTLANHFGLIDADDATDSPNVWLMRAHYRGIGDEFGKAVQEAPQSRQRGN